MSDTKLAVFNNDGQTAYLDIRTESTNGEGRQVVVLGDPTSNNAVTAVQATDPASNTEGLVVRDVNTSAIAAFLGGTLGVYLNSTAGTLNIQLKPGTIAVQLDPGHLLGSVTGAGTFGVYLDSTQGTVAVQLKAGTLAVFLDPGHLLGAVTANAGTGTFTVSFDPGHELGTIKGNSNTLTVFLPDTGHTLGKVDAGVGTFNVQLDPGHTLGAITTLQSITNTVNVQLDPGHTLGKVEPGVGTFQVYLPDTGHEIGSIRGITNSIAAHILSTGGTIQVKVDPSSKIAGIDSSIAVYLQSTAGTLNMQLKPGTIAVSLDPGTTLGKADQGIASTTQGWLVNTSSTLVVPIVAAGSFNGVSTLGKTIAGPTSSRVLKIYAYSITTTAQTSLTAKLTNGAGSSPTIFEEWALQAPAQGISGANLAVTPPGYLFATPSGATLALVLDSASLVHYSFKYFEESA